MKSILRPGTVIQSLLAVFGLCLGLWAQERFGEISGVVSDPTSAAVPGATVTLTNKDTNRSITLRSGSDGAYLGTNLEPGRYKIRVEAKGFSANEVPDVNLLVGKVLKVDAQLKVGATSDTVQVIESS